MKQTLVGGPLLGEQSSGNGSKKPLVASWTTFAPIITDPIGQQRFVLLPSRRFVTVLAYKTGKRIATLLPSLDDLSVTITSVALASGDLLAKSVLFVGCQDGSIREFDMDELTKSATNHTLQDCGPYLIPGPCFRPRRVLHIADNKCTVKHMGVVVTPKDPIVYALVENSSPSEKESSSLSLLRIMIPAPSKTQVISLETLQSHIHCLDENVKIRTEKGKEPFNLVVTSRANEKHDGQISVVVVLPSTLSILFYHEILHEEQTRSFSPFKLKISQSNVLCALAISPNQKDVACGHAKGSIKVLTDILARIEKFNQTQAQYKAQSEGGATIKKPKSPAKELIVRKLHWHAHPVATLSFNQAGGNSMLFSGADESVVATWQLDRGITKPVETLPRVALGGIVHIVSAHQTGEPDSVLVYCSDNSLHLFETHNQFLKWKVNGLAAAMFPCRPKMLANPLDGSKQSSRLVLTGLPQAPGQIQTYDPRAQRVVSSLEVVPYNRVSRTEPGDSPMPTPTVSHCSWSDSGEDLITIDTVPTENHIVGVSERLDNGSLVGTVTTIRFWSLTKNAYELVAAMTWPHGSTSRISALTISPNGKFACTVSNDERAFRLWRRVDSATKSFEWVCRYKVDVPSGYSNYPTGASAIAFSSDASVLAIAFGHMITLWDHHEVTLLTSLRHLDNHDSTIESVQFLNSATLKDALLVSSAGGVSLQSPYGRVGPVGMGWVWEIPFSIRNLRVSSCGIIPGCGFVSIALFDESSKMSRIVLVDVLTGEISNKSPTGYVHDKVVAVTGFGSNSTPSGWDDEPEPSGEEPCTVFVLLSNGELVSFQTDRAQTDREYSRQEDLEVSAIPKLPQQIRGLSSRKRTASVLTVADLETGPKKRILSLDNFGGFVGEETIVSSLPQLNGAFARAFVGRHLHR